MLPHYLDLSFYSTRVNDLTKIQSPYLTKVNSIIIFGRLWECEFVKTQRDMNIPCIQKLLSFIRTHRWIQKEKGNSIQINIKKKIINLFFVKNVIMWIFVMVPKKQDESAISKYVQFIQMIVEVEKSHSQLFRRRGSEQLTM